MREYVKPMSQGKIIFSLPYLNFEIEKSAKKAICAERDHRTYKQQLEIAPDNCILNYGNASEIMKNYTGQFDLINLDLCGSYSEELFNCIQISSEKIKDNGNVIITLLKGREHSKYLHMIDTDDRINSYQKLLSNEGLYIYQTIEYFDTSPMIVLFAKTAPSTNIIVKEINN